MNPSRVSRPGAPGTLPRVSVLMTVFNTEAHLEEAIGSILSQTWGDLELIAVDDCSTDGSWAIVLDAASRDARVIPVRRRANGGASAGLNEGLALARGEYITRQDSDDVSLPARIAEQVAFLERHPDVAAVGVTVTRVDGAGRPLSAWRVPTEDAEIKATLLETMAFCGPTLMVRRQAFQTAGYGFDETLSGSEDYDLCLRLSEVAALANLPQPLYLYRQHESMVSRSQEHTQLFRKAVALERSLVRRFGPAVPERNLRQVSQDYFRAALLARARQDAAAPEWLERAIALAPALLDDASWLEETVRKCAPAGDPAGALRFADSVFDGFLPATRALARIRRRFVADLHMAEVFAAADGHDAARVRKHIWPAIWSNPAWLVNRGVLALLVKDAVGVRAAGRT